MAADGLRIDYYFSVLSDWAYLGGERLDQIALRHGAAINHLPVRLADVYAGTGGIILQKRSVQRQAYREVELKRWSRRLGVPLVIHPKHYPTDDVLASGVIVAAQRVRLDAGRVANCILRAIWAEERNIADAKTLRSIVEGCGGDGDAILRLAAAPESLRVLDQNTQEAQTRGVFGSPFYICEGEIYWGQDRLEFLEDFLERGAVAREGARSG